MRSTLCTLAAGLLVSAAAEAAVIDFGNDPGQANPTAGLSFGGGFGFNANLSRVRTFNADALSIAYTASATASYAGGGEQVSGTYLSGLSLVGADTSSKLKMEARVITGAPSLSFYEFRVQFYAANGHSSRYHFKLAASSNPSPFSYGTDPATVPFTVVESTTALSAPTAIGASGAFDWANDALSSMDIYFKTGNVTNSIGTATWEIDNMQVTVPEPTMLGLVGVGSLLALRRRRA